MASKYTYKYTQWVENIHGDIYKWLGNLHKNVNSSWKCQRKCIYWLEQLVELWTLLSADAGL